MAGHGSEQTERDKCQLVIFQVKRISPDKGHRASAGRVTAGCVQALGLPM